MRSFLEVGYGTGYDLAGTTSAFPNASLVGREIFVAGVGHAAKRIPGAELVQMDARRMPDVDEFYVVAALDVVEHIPEDELVTEQLYKAIKPSGVVVFSVPPAHVTLEQGERICLSRTAVFCKRDGYQDKRCGI